MEREEWSGIEKYMKKKGILPGKTTEETILLVLKSLSEEPYNKAYSGFYSELREASAVALHWLSKPK